jgi:hypothetical protein
MASQHVIVDTADGYVTVVGVDDQDFVVELHLANEDNHTGGEVKLTAPQVDQLIEALQTKSRRSADVH